MTKWAKYLFMTLIPLALLAAMLYWLLGDFWQSTNGPKSGTVLCLAIASTGDVFAGTEGSGILRYDGKSWTAANSGLEYTKYVWSVLIGSNGVIYAGTDKGLSYSHNNGASWTNLHFDPISSLAINSSGVVFVGQWYSGVWRWDGTHWTPATTGLPEVSPVRSLIADSSGQVWAAVQGSGVFRFSEADESWIPINAGLTDPEVGCLAIDSSGNILTGTEDGGVFRYNGTNWAAFNTGLPPKTGVWSLASNSSGHIFLGTYGGVFRYNGTNWAEASTGLSIGPALPVVRCLAVDPSGFVFAGNWSTVFRSVKTTT
jgi:ligand-binding sensor domain-containing protein